MEKIKEEEMEKIGKFIKNHILLDTIIYIVLILVSKIILNIFQLEYRNWVYFGFIILAIIGIVIGIFQYTKRFKKEEVRLLANTVILVAIILVCIIIGPFVIFLCAVAYTPEHVVEKDNHKMVAHVISFMKTNVDYYNYINPFLRGKKLILSEYYGSGSFDPFDEDGIDREVKSYHYYDEEGDKIANKDDILYDKDGNVVNNLAGSSSSHQSEVENKYTSSEGKVAYLHYTDEMKGHKVEIKACAMGKEAIKIYATTDGGKTWASQLSTEKYDNGALWVYYNSKFLFVDEKIGFIYDPGRDGVADDYGYLLVTQDGGKTFQEAVIEHPASILESHLIIDNVPEEKDGKLTLKIFTLNNANTPRRTDYEYITEDNGLHWMYHKKL